MYKRKMFYFHILTFKLLRVLGATVEEEHPCVFFIGIGFNQVQNQIFGILSNTSVIPLMFFY